MTSQYVVAIYIDLWDIPLQYSCLENPKDRGAWWAMVHGVTKSPNATEATEHAGSTMGGTDKNQ